MNACLCQRYNIVVVFFLDTTISQQESQSVVLPCPVDAEKCGKLHSLNWFKGDDRIAAMLLGDSNVTSVNKEFDERYVNVLKTTVDLC